METATERKFTMDGRRVLVLDAALQPVQIVTWQRAFVMLSAGKAHVHEGRKKRGPEIITYSRDGAVIGVRQDIRVPSIIQLGEIVPRHRQRVRFCRKNVIVGRDQCICQYCTQQFSTEDLTIDHVVPRSQGGQTCWENVVAACFRCNQKKAGRTPEQALMKLLKQPKRPHTVVETTVSMDIKNIPVEWHDYWGVTLDK